MNKAELKILEGAFEAEINGALSGQSSIFQSRSKVAKKLAEEGFLQESTDAIGGGALRVTISGYTLTHAGRLAYCLEQA